MFGKLVDRIKQVFTVLALKTLSSVSWILLVEIYFDHNSFEQLYVSITPMKTPAISNHHMFILEQDGNFNEMNGLLSTLV
jgi:myosin heavy subunit